MKIYNKSRDCGKKVRGSQHFGTLISINSYTNTSNLKQRTNNRESELNKVDTEWIRLEQDVDQQLNR